MGEFMPSPAAVLTVSAPNMLLSASLNSFLLGLGTYLAYVWTRHLDTTAGTNDSLAIFITYVASLTACYGIYELSGLELVRRSHTTEKLVNPPLMPLRQRKRDEKSSNFQPTSARARGSTDGAGMSRDHTVKEELIQECTSRLSCVGNRLLPTNVLLNFSNVLVNSNGVKIGPTSSKDGNNGEQRQGNQYVWKATHLLLCSVGKIGIW
jgi:hypothetical protein